MPINTRAATSREGAAPGFHAARQSPEDQNKPCTRKDVKREGTFARRSKAANSKSYGPRVRSQRPRQRSDGSITFDALKAGFRVPKSAPEHAANSRDILATSTGWTETVEAGDTYTVFKGSITRKCLTQAAAREVAAIYDAILLLERTRAPDEVLILAVASAPEALDGDRVAHCSNVGKRLNRLIKSTGRTPRILRLNEQWGAGFHSNFVFPLAASAVPKLTRIATHHVTICQHDASGALAFHAQVVTGHPGGLTGLAWYLSKEARHGKELDAGGDRLQLNDALESEMMAAELWDSQQKKRPKRGLPRAHANPVTALTAPVLTLIDGSKPHLATEESTECAPLAKAA